MLVARTGTSLWPPRGPLQVTWLHMSLLTSPGSSFWSQDGSVLNILPPPPEESSSGNQPDDRKDLPRGPFEAPVLLDRDRWVRAERNQGSGHEPQTLGNTGLSAL